METQRPSAYPPFDKTEQYLVDANCRTRHGRIQEYVAVLNAKAASLSIEKRLLKCCDNVDLIRHGKHARAPAAQAASPIISTSPAADPSSSSPSSVKHQQRQEREKEREHERRAKVGERVEELANQAQVKPQRDGGGGAAVQPAPAVQTPNKEIAEYIVKEEREAKSKLPVYPGLEQFKLIEKMGE